MPATAFASSPTTEILAQCNRGQITGHFTAADLRAALAHMGPGTSEYTSCPNEINAALNAALGRGRSSGGGSGGSSSATILIIVVIVVVLGGTAATVVARRRQQGAGPGPGDEPQP
jgi:hypothetical protein